MEAYMLTTVDNPYNPFTQFDEWFAFDTNMGYFSSEYLSRIANTSDELSDEDNAIEINRAINEIIYFDVLGIYQKVSKDNFEEIKSRPLTKENEEALSVIYSNESE